MTTYPDGGYAMSVHEYAARVLPCVPTEWCSGTQGYEFAGRPIGPDGVSFDRYRCTECGVNRPESSIGLTVLEREVPLPL